MQEWGRWTVGTEGFWRVILICQKVPMPEPHHKEGKLFQCSSNGGEKNSACAEHHLLPHPLVVADHELALLQPHVDFAMVGARLAVK